MDKMEEQSVDFSSRNRWGITTSTPVSRRRSVTSSTYSPANDSGYPESIAETSTTDYNYTTPDCHIKPFDNVTRCRQCDKHVCSCDSEFNSVLWENAPKVSRDITDFPPYDFEFDSFDLECGDSATQLSDNFDTFGLSNVLQHFSPTVPDRLIGRKIGIESVDILSEMDARNISSVSRILDYLEPVDLCRVHNVCHRWRTILRTHGKVRARRRKFLKLMKSMTKSAGKENVSKVLKWSNGRHLTSGNILTMIQSCPANQLVPANKSINPFEHAALSLRSDEALRHCPNCQSVAKMYSVQERGVCLNDKCAFDFCVRCFNGHHGSKNCVPLSTGKSRLESVGSAKSKKNLRRL